jgi:hypothetical protein
MRNTDMAYNMGCWMEYIGKSPVYQGHKALLRPIHFADQAQVLIKLDENKQIMAQFPDLSPNWLPFNKTDFQVPGAKPVF